MTEEAQRIAIAEACGWTITQIKVNGMEDVAILPPGVPQTDEAIWDYAGIELPDYLSDLNAMHEAENYLSKDAFRRYYYVKELNARLNRDARSAGDAPLGPTEFDSLRATAAQRAEAFLRAIGRFKE